MKLSLVAGFLAAALSSTAFGWESGAAIQRVVNGTTLYLLPDDMDVDQSTADMMPVRFRTPPANTDPSRWHFESTAEITNSTSVSWNGANLYCSEGRCRLIRPIIDDYIEIIQVNQIQSLYFMRTRQERRYLTQRPDLLLGYELELSDASYFHFADIWHGKKT